MSLDKNKDTPFKLMQETANLFEETQLSFRKTKTYQELPEKYTVFYSNIPKKDWPIGYISMLISSFPKPLFAFLITANCNETEMVEIKGSTHREHFITLVFSIATIAPFAHSATRILSAMKGLLKKMKESSKIIFETVKDKSEFGVDSHHIADALEQRREVGLSFPVRLEQKVNPTEFYLKNFYDSFDADAQSMFQDIGVMLTLQYGLTLATLKSEQTTKKFSQACAQEFIWLASFGFLRDRKKDENHQKLATLFFTWLAYIPRYNYTRVCTNADFKAQRNLDQLLRYAPVRFKAINQNNQEKTYTTQFTNIIVKISKALETWDWVEDKKPYNQDASNYRARNILSWEANQINQLLQARNSFTEDVTIKYSYESDNYTIATISFTINHQFLNELKKDNIIEVKCFKSIERTKPLRVIQNDVEKLTNNQQKDHEEIELLKQENKEKDKKIQMVEQKLGITQEELATQRKKTEHLEQNLENKDKEFNQQLENKDKKIENLQSQVTLLTTQVQCLFNQRNVNNTNPEETQKNEQSNNTNSNN